MKSPVTLLSCLLDDVKRQEPDVKGLDRDLQTIESRFKHEGYGFLSVTLSSLCDAFDRGISSGSFACPSSFRKVRGGALPRFLSGLLCKVFDTKTGLLLEEPCVRIVKFVREVLRLFKKVKLSPKRSERLEREAIAKFLETDSFISEFSFREDRTQLLRAVSKVVLSGLDGLDITTLPYKHGPGGVAEKLKANAKWVRLKEELRDNASLAYVLGYDDKTRKSLGIIDCDSSISGLPLFESPCYHVRTIQQYASEGVAKLITVPKDSTSLRTITAEPVVKQFFQQGLNTYLRRNISDCGVLSSCLALTDQSKNQVLARIGSLNNKYSTLDLSSASDLLSVSLVSEAFSARPVFLQYALTCRSPLVDTGNGIVPVLKFAGMGNALTFPVQSVTFSLIAICAILEYEGKEPSYVNAKRASRRIRVFGDDIIVHTKYVHQVADWLTSFGLKVNQKKSFFEGNFKESCGIDAFKGVDVTPVYLRYEPIISARDPEKIASLVSTGNQLWLRGLYSAAECIRNTVDSFIKLPLVSRNSSSLGWHSRGDTTIAQKWDRKLHRLVFRGQVITTCKQDDDISNDNAALIKSLTLLERRDEVQRESDMNEFDRQVDPILSDPLNLQRSVKRFKTRIVSRWVPAQAG